MKCKECGDVSCTRRRSENSECFFEENLRKQKELEEMPYWKHFRAEAAKDILCATLSGGTASGMIGIVPEKETIVKASIEIADELVKQLKEKEEK